MQKWKKLGKIYCPSGKSEWQHSHAMMPTVIVQNNRIEIYYSTRDRQNQSRPSKLTLELDEKLGVKIVDLSENPILNLGELGMYDDAGVIASCVVLEGQTIRMFYNGWTLGVKTPFTSFNGIAESYDNGETFDKLSSAPKALNRNDVDPFSTFSPFVLKTDKKWHMWYVSLVKWEKVKNEVKHYYHIKYAYSNDGLSWIREGQVCIDFKSKREYAIARPCVIYENNIFKMWFSYRGSINSETYRIGYAESVDAKEWKRMDENVSLSISKTGWDSEMVCYPYVFDYRGSRYMLYNGNNYGETGFGIAILER